MQMDRLRLPLDEEEWCLEDDARKNGVARYRDKVRKQGLRSSAGSAFGMKWISPLIRTIKLEQSNLLNGRSDAKFHGEKILFLTIDAERLAFITLDCIFDGLVSMLLDEEDQKDVEARWLMDQIGRNCFMEYIADRRREYLGRSQNQDPVQELVISSQLRINRPSAFRAATDYERKLKQRAMMLIRQTTHARNSREGYSKLYNEYFRLGGLLLECAKRARLVLVKEGQTKVWAKRSAKEGEVTQPIVIHLTAHLEASLSSILREYTSICSPLYSPMVRPPRAWEGLQAGGYLRNCADPYFGSELVKYRNRRRFEEVCKETSLDRVMRAVNALQNVRWRVNESILKSMRRLAATKQQFPGLPAVPRLPRKPAPSRPKEEFRNWWIAWRRAKRSRLAAMLYRCKLMPDRLKMAQEMVGKTIYFPYFLDFRGRAYPVPRVFHPQDDDIGRALIEFAEGKLLGRSGAYWLAIHLANLYGKDKDHFRARRAWVRQNETKIIHLAENCSDPAIEKWWLDADKPFCFLATCKEWSEYCKLRDEGRGRDFKSHIPVAMDGTCNGLQHLSALGRDPTGGRLTNLRPSSHPQDIYWKVAEEMLKSLRNEARRKTERFKLARWLLEQVGCKRLAKKIAGITSPQERSRKRLHRAWRIWVQCQVRRRRLELGKAKVICKRLQRAEEKTKKRVIQASIWSGWLKSQKFPRRVARKVAKAATMNKPYGAKQGGIAEQLVDQSLVPGRLEEQLSNANFIAGILFDCLPKVVATPVGIMDWLQDKIALPLANIDQGISWISPSGFPVVHEYRRAKQQRIRTRIGRFSLPDPTSKGKELFKKKQVDAIVANFVHSLDAAHMALTVNALSRAKIKACSAIHDSYSVHACNVELLRRLTRKQFVKIHRGNILKEFWIRQCQHSGLNLDPPPRRGVLDIKEVLQSKYFFC